MDIAAFVPANTDMPVLSPRDVDTFGSSLNEIWKGTVYEHEPPNFISTSQYFAGAVHSSIKDADLFNLGVQIAFGLMMCYNGVATPEFRDFDQDYALSLSNTIGSFNTKRRKHQEKNGYDGDDYYLLTGNYYVALTMSRPDIHLVKSSLEKTLNRKVNSLDALREISILYAGLVESKICTLRDCDTPGTV
jgi:hypothetical protein